MNNFPPRRKIHAIKPKIKFSREAFFKAGMQMRSFVPYIEDLKFDFMLDRSYKNPSMIPLNSLL
jgi:hypothetical protein